MQPTEDFNITRRALDVEDYIDILRRHKGWVFGPFLLTLVASVVGVYLYPDSYTSVAIVKIVQQQVPQNMVQTSVNQDMTDSISAMATTILNRNVLTTIINNFDLYKSERKHLPTDDVVEMMRKHVTITPIMAAGGNGRNIPAFRVEFTYQDRMMANRVTQDVVSRFVSESSSNRTNATIEATQFMKDQRDQAKKELEALEERYSRFRITNNGRLPDQVDMNARNLTTLQTNYQILAGNKNRAMMDKLTNETNLSVEKSRKSQLEKEVPMVVNAVPVKSDRLLEIEREIRQLEDGLNQLLQRYTEAYPQVTAIKGRLEIAKERKQSILKEEAENKQPALAPVANRQLQGQISEVEGNILRLESAVHAKDLEIAELDNQIKQVQEGIRKMDGQISSAPLGEQEYGDLIRERDLARAHYIDLDGRLNTAQLSQDLENRGQGQKLEVLDAASLPQYPSEPKRPIIIGMGAGIGLLLGVVIAAAREMKDTSLKNLKDVRAYTQMAILGSVPLLENDFVVRRRKRMAWLGWTTASLMGVLTMAGSIVYYYSKV